MSLDPHAVVDPSVVAAMAARLAHRGPDGGGRFEWPAGAPRVALGMRRLAIIDLPTGQQPVGSEDGSVVVVSNGEIYNYVELREQLRAGGHLLQSHGDTEVIAHLYEDHGLELFDHLRGMYACAIWDRPRERLVLAVDHLGIKPLYVHRSPSALHFASELAALLPGVAGRRVDLGAVETYVTFGYPVGPRTLVEGIERVPPGTALIVERGQVMARRHWRPVFAAGGQATGGDAPRVVRKRLDEAVRLHLRSDVPLGLFLSGGLDSAGLLALAHREHGAVRTFTVGYEHRGRPAADETSAAGEAAARVGAVHTTLRLTPDAWWQTLVGGAAVLDEPIANPSMVSLEALARDAAREVRVVLNGTGGDELFGGYAAHRQFPRMLAQGAWLDARAPHAARDAAARVLAAGEGWYPYLRRWPLLARVPERAARTRAALLPRDEGLRRVASFEALAVTDTLRHELYGADLLDAWRRGAGAARAYREIYDECQAQAPTGQDLAQTLVMATWLPGNGLLSLDKATMAHGLEARVPYFDRRLVEDVLRLGAGVRLAPRKALLAAALGGDVPEDAARQAKKPFATPLDLWFGHELAPRAAEVLLDPGARIRSLVRASTVERLIARQSAGRIEQAEVIFRLVVLELWWRRVIEP